MKHIIQITKGIIRDRPMRRQAMFVLVAVALAMVFLGATFFSKWLADEPQAFVAYWAACAWLTFTAVLLAFHDMAAMRAALRREREELKRKILGGDDE